MILLGYISQVAAFEVVIAATPYQQEKYQAFLNGRDCQEIDSYIGENAFRITLEIAILCKALHYGGLPAKIKFKSAPNYSRGLLEVKKGNVVMSAATTWADEIDETILYKSEPLFASREFVKGFFTTPALKQEIEIKIAHAANMQKTPLSVLQAYPFLSNNLWKQDWAMLKALNLPAATTMSINKSICKIIEAERASLYLGELVMIGQSQLGFPCDNIQLVPIDGFKVAFHQSRHYAVSKRHPNGKLVYTALQIGIQEMRKSGEIASAQYPEKSKKLTLESWVDLSPNPKRKKNQ